MLQKKKQINIVLITACVGIAVYFLYPIGNEFLNFVRAQNDSQVVKIKSGKEVIYSYIDKGNLRNARGITENKYEIDRFDPVEIHNITWEEDPYSDVYWRFNFYNLKTVRDLLFAWGVTGDHLYKDKLIEITESFIDKGMGGPYSWDYHGTAFRTMTLVNVWWKLYKKNELPEDLKAKIEQTLAIHGNFLADSSHYEKDYNHGLDQSAALYLLAVNFPNIPGADAWRTISSERISELITGIVSEDGILVENSPFYHFYVLEKFWEINAYTKRNNLPTFDNLEGTIRKMISYATYVLQPDLNIPTIGASLQRHINLAGVYAQMAGSAPDLLYVLTQGAQGVRPANLHVVYPINGQAIMRSGWSTGTRYANQTQVIFDVGSYRTNHSDLDALSFNLYSNGLTLMPDAGLYAYEGPYREYFHGTRAHNTVVVDGKDQATGEKHTGSIEKVYFGFFEEGDGYVYQSGEHELYQGVSHQRALAMIEGSTILVLDTLKSSSPHTYEQMFHLFPGAEIRIDGTTLTANGSDSKQALTIRQLITDGVELHAAIGEQSPTDGFCSAEYKIAIPCHSIAYLQEGRDVSYITVISIGKNQAVVDFEKDKNLLTVETKSGSYNIKINETKGVERNIDVNKKFDISHIYSSVLPVKALNILESWYQFNKSSVGSVTINREGGSLEVALPANSPHFEVANDVNLDLTGKNIYFKVKVDTETNLEDFTLSLSNDKWRASAEYDLKRSVFDVKNIIRDNEWFQFGLGEGDLRKEELGSWKKSDPTFDWSKIDSIKFTIEPKREGSVTINIKEFGLAPKQKEARAVIVFDDGWLSVLDAAKVMRKYDLKGNIAVITGSVDKKNYLTLNNLKTLQNEYGWNIVNHTNSHKNATVEYVYTNNLKEYRDDITDALQFLIQNDINSAPNWFIYPHGNSNKSTREIIGQYYKFARATINGQEFFPFAEPLEVKVFPVYSDDVTTKDVRDALYDAKTYKQTIMLMFHKFSEGIPSIFTEWQLSEFEAILKYIKEQEIKVVTLSELDKELGIPETEFMIRNFVPQQFSLDISVNRKTLLQRLNIIR